MANKTAIADLSHRIDLLKPITQAKWKAMGTVWASVKRPGIKSGAMLGSAAAVVVTQGFTIRQRDDVKKGWRVRYDGEIYDIMHIDKSVRGELTLTCRDIEVKT